VRRVDYRVAVFVLLSQVLTVLWLWPATVLAAGGKSVAIFIEGGDAAQVAGELKGALPSELGVVDAKAFADAFRKAGQSGPMGNAIGVKGALRDKILEKAQKALSSVGADAAILGRVRIGKAGKEVWVVWVSSDGDVKVDQSVSLRGDSSERSDAMHGALDGPAKALVPPPSTSSPSTGGGSGTSGGDSGGDKGDPDKDKDGDKPKGTRLAHNAGTSLFALSAAFEMGGRIVELTDPITLNIRPYQVIGAPMIHVAGEVYPAASTGIKVLKDIGLTGRFSMALGLSSSTADGTASTSNTWMRFRGGLKWRFLPGEEKGPILALVGELGMDIFSFDNAGDLAAQVPTVEYQYLRAGGEVRLPLGPVAFELGGGYRGLLGVGETGNRFTNPQALAFDAMAGFVVMLPAGFEARLSADYTRVFYAFASELDDAYVAGGMVDEMLGARVGVAYVY
jgi:hypothetical protein